MKSFKWLKSKGATLNLENKKDNKCFQYAPTLALNHQNIGKDLQKYQKSHLLLINIIGEG